MKERSLVLYTVVFLLIMGSFGIIARSIAFRKIYPSRGDSVWGVRFRILLQPAKRGTSLRISLPSDTTHLRKLRQAFSHPGFSMYTIKKTETSDQQVIAVVQSNNGILEFNADFDIHIFPNAKKSSSIKTIMKSDKQLHYLRSEEEIQVKSRLIEKLAKTLSEGLKGKRDVVNAIYSFCSEQIADSDATGSHDALGTLSTQKGSPLGRVRLMAALCRACRIPARLVTGFVLAEEQNAAAHYWLEVYIKKRWVPFDPVYGFTEEIPSNYLPVRKDSIHIVKADKQLNCRFHCRIKRNNQMQSSVPFKKYRWLTIIDLTRLPLSMQEILALLLLLPAGALITSLFRNVIGIQTLGTFTPALLALSFVYADWRFGIAVFVFIFTIGLIGRHFLDLMKLLMVPRLSVILTIIVLCLTISVSVLDFLKLSPSAQAVILPIVILTMMIERLYIHSEEDCPLRALQLLAGTLLVSTICFILLKWQYMGSLVVRFPEAQFLIAACLILIGRYSGYRLSELWRFSAFKDYSFHGNNK